MIYIMAFSYCGTRLCEELHKGMMGKRWARGTYALCWRAESPPEVSLCKREDP